MTADKRVYLNNATTTFPKPAEVTEAIFSHLKAEPFHHARTGFSYDEGSGGVNSCRAILASFFNAEKPERMIFTSGATESLNQAIFGLCLDRAHVITTATEHNSVLRPLKTLERDGKITLTIIECDASGWVDPVKIKEAVNSKTKVIVVNHCSNVTGTVNDIAAIGNIAQKNDIIFIVDAAQSAGVFPIDVQAMNIDLLAFTGHKSLYGIQGIGGLYIREGIKLRPIKAGGTGIRSDYLFQPEELPLYYEAGTMNIPGIVALYKGLEFVKSKGEDYFREQKNKHVKNFYEFMGKKDGITLYPSPDDLNDTTTLFSFNIKGLSPEDVGYMLDNAFGITVRTGLHCAPLIHEYIGSYPEGNVRISPSSFTSAEEVDYFLEAVSGMYK